MKRLLILLSLAMYALFGSAQNQNPEPKFAIKFSNLTTFEEFRLINSWDGVATTTDTYFDYSDLSLIQPTIAFQLISKNSNFHELELIHLTYGSNDFKESYQGELTETLVSRRGSVRTLTNLSLKYEYIYTFRKGADTRLKPALGIGLNPQYLNLINEPPVALDWKTENSLFVFRIQVTPRIAYFVSPRAFLELSLPITVLDFKHNRYHVENPMLIEELRTSKISETSFFPIYYSGRISFGIMF